MSGNFHDTTPDWRTFAACAGDDPDRWVFRPSTKGRDAKRVDALKAICATCPVNTRCLDEELQQMRIGIASYGVFGGTTPDERRDMLGMTRVRGERRHHRPVAPIEHGTVAGYVKHIRYRDVFGDPCRDCSDANNARQALYKRQADRRIRQGVEDWLQRDHPTPIRRRGGLKRSNTPL